MRKRIALVIVVLCMLIIIAPINADGYNLGSDIPSPVNEEIKVSDHEIELSIGGAVRLRYERWRNGDIIPDSQAENGQQSSAWRDRYNDDYTLTNIKTHVNADIDEYWRGFIEIEYATIESSNKIDGHRRYDSSSSPHIYQGYIEYDDSTSRLRLGRQTLDYGSRMVLGTNNWLNNTVSYDVFRYDYTGESTVASIFAGVEAFESHDQDEEPDNVVAGYHVSRNVEKWLLEHYLFYKNRDQRNGANDFDTYSVGARVNRIWARYDMDIDLIKQVGGRQGFASHGFFSWYLLPDHWTQARLFSSYNVAAGGRRDKDNYIPFSPAGHLDRQSTDFSPFTNLAEYGFGLTTNPLKNRPLYVRFSWFDMYKYDKNGGIYAFDSSNLVWGQATRDRHLGQHFSLFATYKFEKTRTDISMCLNKYFIGDAIDEFSDRDDNNFFYVAVKQHF